MNNITIHELRPFNPSQTLLIPVEEEVSPGNFVTGNTNLFDNIGYALFDTLSSGLIREIKAARFTTLHGSSNRWDQAATFFIANSATLVNQSYVNALFTPLSSVVNLNTETVTAKTIYTEEGGNSTDWDAATTIVKENSAVKVINYSSNKHFTQSDSGKIHHFNTTPNATLSAIIPDDITSGFNITIMNTGQGSVQIFASSLASVGDTINTQYSGAYIYKDNGVVYAVGNLVI